MTINDLANVIHPMSRETLISRFCLSLVCTEEHYTVYKTLTNNYVVYLSKELIYTVNSGPGELLSDSKAKIVAKKLYNGDIKLYCGSATYKASAFFLESYKTIQYKMIEVKKTLEEIRDVLDNGENRPEDLISSITESIEWVSDSILKVPKISIDDKSTK